MKALLLAEPEPAVRGFLERQLRNDGFDVVACERAEQLPRAADPDVLVLGDAEALDRGVVPDCPVIVLGSADPAARVRALARADDCLARPFVYEELLARIHALLRRCPPRLELLEVPPLAIDRAARRVTVNGNEVELSAKEFALLVKLASGSRPCLHARATAPRRLGLPHLRPDADARVARLPRPAQARRGRASRLGRERVGRGLQAAPRPGLLRHRPLSRGMQASPTPIDKPCTTTLRRRRHWDDADCQLPQRAPQTRVARPFRRPRSGECGASHGLRT